MKTSLVLLCILSLSTAAFGQAPVAQNTTQQPYTAEELDQMLGPIALYPDPLIGLILPAATMPSDIVMADRYVEQNGDPAQIANQPWDDSVKGLTHYPDLLKWLDQNLAWTTQIGAAYLAQPADVMNSIQQLRARARADGTLMNSDQQQVGVDDSGDIAITPTDPNTIYVPQYDTDAVYDDDYTLDDGPVISYGAGCPVGPWLYYWPNWQYRCIYLGNWQWWRIHPGGTGFAGGPTRPWRANPGRTMRPFVATSNAVRPAVVIPHALPGVTLIQSKHPSSPTNTRPGFISPPQGIFAGRGQQVAAPGPIVARPIVVQTPTGGLNAFSEYGRGSDARAASERGQYSRQSYGVPGGLPVVRTAPVGGGAGTGGRGAPVGGGGGGRGGFSPYGR